MRPKKPEDVKLVVSLFTGLAGLFPEALERLQDRYGPIDLLSEPLDFNYTDYYKDEFGSGLKRKVASFENLVGPDELAKIKVAANSLEESFLTGDKKRRINIDPGILSLERFVLASRKNFAHRIYLGDGVYADLTLIYAGGSWKPLEWTYPDYKEDRLKTILTQIRMRYAFQIGRGLQLPF